MIAALNKILLAGRFVLVAFFLGLVAALALYAVKFVIKVAEFAGKVFSQGDQENLLAILLLLDSALVASLVVTVAFSSWDTLVARLNRDQGEDGMAWVAKVDAGNLKIKLATALIAISGINLLQMFLNVERTPDRVLTWAVAIHGVFLLSVVMLAVADRLENTTARKERLETDQPAR